MVRTEDACEIIKYALQNEIKVYLDGGWGVDALLKRESRIHKLKIQHPDIYEEYASTSESRTFRIKKEAA
ncbi:nucleotidyltransferase domain-containing protein [Blautia obeum]|uniref:Uncharacterized protein n=1 Tax=Blautia obeum TaxID=40520 RepID=A0A174NG89_9FIRM|nr:hypothetical protein [Blautia obeum]CUP45520.1 Uncharacterised protein [Blautia obeum]